MCEIQVSGCQFASVVVVNAHRIPARESPARTCGLAVT
jgi:hypothetical protein